MGPPFGTTLAANGEEVPDRPGPVEDALWGSLCQGLIQPVGFCHSTVQEQETSASKQQASPWSGKDHGARDGLLVSTAGEWQKITVQFPKPRDELPLFKVPRAARQPTATG